MLAEATRLLPTGLYATLPFWPLLGALLVGLLIAIRQKPERANWPIVLGVAVSAALGLMLFLDLPGALRSAGLAGHWQRAGSAEAQAQELFTTLRAGDPHASGIAYTVYNWISLGDEPSLQKGHWFALDFYFDGLTGVMLLFVTIV